MNGDKIIEINSLTKDFKDLRAVNSLNLNVFEGDVFGFLGPNGAGKSTTIRMLLSLIKPTEGSIKLFDKTLQKNRIEILKRIGAIVEKPDFYGYLSAFKNLEILGKISGKEISKNRIMEVLELVGLSKRYKSKVKTFSHGMKQRLGLGQALLHNPDLIILDEPTTGLDPITGREISHLMVEVQKKYNTTSIIISHDLNCVKIAADSLVMLIEGKNYAEGTFNEMKASTDPKIKLFFE